MRRSILGLGMVLLALSAGCGPKSMKARMANGENRAERASELIDEADREMRALEPDRAERKLKEAREQLSDRDVDLYPEGDLLRSRLTEANERLVLCRDERNRRDLEVEAQKRQQEVEKALAELKSAQDDLGHRTSGKTEVDHARDAARRVRDRLEDGKSFEAKDKKYGEFAQQARKQMDEVLAKAAILEKTLEFASGPLGERKEGMALSDKAKAERDMDKRLGLYTQARKRFVACNEDGLKLISATPGLDKATVEVDGSTTTVKAAAVGCQAKVDGLDRTLEKLLKAQAAVARATERKGKGKKKR